MTVVQHLKEGVIAQLGNGFFVSVDGGLYLVTCLHIIQRAIRNKQSFGDGWDADHLISNNQEMFKSEALFLKLRAKKYRSFHNHRVELYDSLNRRTWRSYSRPEDYWDVAVIELNPDDLANFDLRPWTEEEFLPADTGLAPGTRIFILTHGQKYNDTPAPFDAEAVVDRKEHQIFASSHGAMMTNPLYPGASGSLVYTVRTNGSAIEEQRKVLEPDTEIQVAGIFTGAFPTDNPQGGHFHYIDTAAAIIRSDQDCLDEDGSNFRSP